MVDAPSQVGRAPGPGTPARAAASGHRGERAGFRGPAPETMGTSRNHAGFDDDSLARERRGARRKGVRLTPLLGVEHVELECFDGVRQVHTNGLPRFSARQERSASAHQKRSTPGSWIGASEGQVVISLGGQQRAPDGKAVAGQGAA
jgi:hypothetical protein